MKRIIPVFTTICLHLFCMLSVAAPAGAEQVLKTEFQDSQPKYIRTNSGFTGVCVEILQELNHRLAQYGMRIDLPSNFTPIKRIHSHLEQGVTDLHCGAARSRAREKRFHFSSKPLYDVRTVIVGRADEPVAVHSLDDLIRYRASVSTVYGTKTYRLLHSKKGLLLGPMPKDPVNGLAMVQKGRTRFFVYHDLGIRWLIRSLGQEAQFTLQPAVVRRYSHWMIYSPRLDQGVWERIDSELEELQASGVIRKIMESYVATYRDRQIHAGRTSNRD